MASWGVQFSSGDQSEKGRLAFWRSAFQRCPCGSNKIEQTNHVAGCRMNGDAYGTTVFRCSACQWTTSFQYDDASDVYYYETRGWKEQ
jgi:hypothetical protein